MNIIVFLCCIGIMYCASFNAMESTNIYILEEEYKTQHPEDFFRRVCRHRKWLQENEKKLPPSHFNEDNHRTELTYNELKKSLSQKQVIAITQEIEK